MDLYGRRIVGWSMDNHMRTELVSSALKQAIGRTEAKEGLIIHSDRGIQYASNKYQELLKKHKFICSMSRKGNCYDNAPMEWLNDYNLKTRKEAKKAVFEYIELSYNRHRTHSANGYIATFMFKEVS